MLHTIYNTIYICIYIYISSSVLNLMMFPVDALLQQGLYTPRKKFQEQKPNQSNSDAGSKRLNLVSESRFPHVPTLQIASCPDVSPSPRPTSMCPGCERQHFAALPGRHPKPSATQATAATAMTRPELLRLLRFLAWFLALLQIQRHGEGKRCLVETKTYTDIGYMLLYNAGGS